MIKITIKNIVVKWIKLLFKPSIIRNLIEKEIKQETEPNKFKFVKLSSSLSRELNIIPSQTTEGERSFLYHYFRSEWTGVGNVIEIGPFLGGTTRAIAMGMLDNPRRTNKSKLYTFDRFQDYFDVDDLKQYLLPLMDSGQLNTNDLNELGERSKFIEIFKSIHESHSYYECIEPSEHGVPDRVEDKSINAWMKIPELFITDAVFIDGCKSWYGTKYFIQIISSSIRPGTVLIFQDFAWFTCFWLPAFIELFEDFFTLIGNVDNTYVFRLDKFLTSDMVENTFPDTPHSIDLTSLSNLFENQIKKAILRNDHYAAIRHTLHKAGALAYTNNLNEAKKTIKLAEQMEFSIEHKTVIEMAWKSPTYTPDGPIVLGK